MQLDLQDCGVGVINYLVKYYKGRISIEKLRHMTYTNKNGTNMYLMKECLIRLGFTSSGYKIDFNDLGNFRLPLIAQITKNDSKHFVVILNIDKQKITIFDPALGVINYKKNVFQEWFTSYILTAYPRAKIVFEENTNNFKKILFNLIVEQRKSLLILILLSILLSIMLVTDTFFLKILIDKINLFNEKIALQLLFVFSGLALIRQIMTYLNNWYLNFVLNKFDSSLVKILHEQLFNLPMSFFEHRTTGEITTRLRAISDFRELLLELIGSLGVNALFLIFSSIILFLISPIICLFCWLLVAALLLLFRLFKNQLKVQMHQAQDSEAVYNNRLIEYVVRMKTIFNLKINKHVSSKSFVAYQKLIADSYRYFKIINGETLIKNMIMVVFNFSILGLSILKIKNGTMSIGTMVQVNTIIIYFMMPIEKLFQLESLFRSSQVAYLRVKDMMDIHTLHYRSESIKQIAFNQLSYAYNGIDQVLHNMNLNFKAGDKILVTGASGAGKSTLFKLLMGYDLNYNGEILINQKKQLNNRLYCLSQGELLFSGTVLENIIIDQPYDKNKLSQVVNICQINLDLNTFINADRVQLSGGECQRIKLARLLYQNPDVLILDEALSEVDKSLETIILNQLLSQYKNQTIIYITHHPSVKKLFNKHINIERSNYVN